MVSGEPLLSVIYFEHQEVPENTLYLDIAALLLQHGANPHAKCPDIDDNTYTRAKDNPNQAFLTLIQKYWKE